MKQISLTILLVFVVFTCVSAFNDPKGPVWSPSFYMAYDQTFVNGGKSFTFNGQFYYDQKNNRMRADKINGRYDDTCASILPNVSTPCQHLITNQKRYIVFPEKKQCCFCCDAAHGCGIVKPNWFEDGKYLGQEKIVDTLYDKWVKPDVSDAFYWATADANQIPRRFAEDNNTHIIDYLTHTFVNKTIPDSIFAIPTYCNTTCASTTICQKFRESKQLYVQEE